MISIQLKNGQVMLLDDDAAWIAERKINLAGLGYPIIRHEGRQQYVHRILSGARKGEEVDHINRNRLDNRRENLRLTSREENLRNIDKPNKTGFRGVYYFKACTTNPWTARIKHNGKQVYLGFHATAEVAARAYDAYCDAHNLICPRNFN